MTMNRRSFLGIAGAAALNAAGVRSMERGGWRLRLDANDNIVSLRKGSLELVDPQRGGDNRPRVSGPAAAAYAVDLVEVAPGAVAVKQTVTVTGTARQAITVDLPRAIRLPFENCSTFLPLFKGIGWRGPSQPQLESAFILAGGHGLTNPRKLALPLVEESSPRTPVRIAYCADPFFTTGIGDSFRWVYSEQVPPPERDERTFWTILHTGSERNALDRFYQTAVARVHKGPDWLHEVALVDYDYLSDNGRGWYRDIDTLEQAIPRGERHKVLLALHGWYGYIGRYTYDPRTRSLARRWVAMPESQAPGVQKLADKYNPRNPYSWRPEAIHALRPVELTLADMHHRIRYAKDRGFRVLLYFGDGVGACQGLKEIYDPAKVLRWGGWVLPDTLGKYYVQNPVHPGVQDFFRGYMQALLTEYGRELDGFVWDETFQIISGDLGTPECPGYAARAMMHLTESLSVMVQEYRPELAFLASDNLGSEDHIFGETIARFHDVPCALVSHGDYQDCAMDPHAWDFGLFPNFRNVMWSCNWGPTGLLKRTRYDVDTFDVPVSISNGYGEDLGISEMTAEQRKSILDLFEHRKSRRMQISWIEEQNGELRYQGRPVLPRPA
jgi:hypothetical protein